MIPGNKIVAIGDVNIDIIIKYKDDKIEGIIEEYSFTLGGSTLNSAIILANSKVWVDFYGKAGRGVPTQFFQKLKALFNNLYLDKSEEKNGMVISLSSEKDRKMLSYRGSNREKISELPEKGDILLLSSYYLIDHELDINLDNFKHKILSIGDSKIELQKDLVNKFDLIFMNEKHYQIGNYINKIKNSELVVTCGENGSFTIFNGKKIFEKQTNKVKVKDTTGAGDAFLAGYVYSRIIEQNDIKSSLKKGNYCGATAITIFGTGLLFIKNELDLSNTHNLKI